MGVKLKKEPQVKAVISTDENLLSKLTLMVPCMGVVLMATMATYATFPAVQAKPGAATVFWVIAGLAFAYTFCTYMWKLTAEPKGIRVRAIPRGERMIFYGDIKRVETKKIGGELAWFTIISKSERKFLKMYRVMTNCEELLERLRKLGIKIVEE